MKTIIVQVVCLLSLSIVDAQPALSAVSADSKIDSVTVYTDGALVTRKSRLNLKAGDQIVHITGLPEELEPGSFRVEITDKNVRVGQISTKSVIYRDIQDQEVQALEKQIDDLEQKIRIQQDTAKSANLQLKLLNSVAAGYGKEAAADLTRGQASVSSWQQALNLMQSGSADAFKTLRATELRISELNKDRDVLTRKLKDKRSKAKKSTSVVLSVNASSAINTTAFIQYGQQDAGWQPAYETRLNTATGQLVVSQKAVVDQSTSEPWRNVKLTLSTSRPDEQVEVPAVSSEFYTLVKPAPVAQAPARAPYRSRAEGDAFSELEEVVVTATRSAPDQWSGSYSLSFPIAGRVDVSNNADQTQRYDLQTFEFDSELVTQIAPTESENAFLAARFTYNGTVPLYGSEMLVFVDGTFSGQADMPSILPGKEITMPMGQDPRIEIRTIDLAAQNNQTGLLKKQNVKAQDLVFEVINRRPNAADIEVRSAFPVSKHKSLMVKIGKDSTPPTNENADDLKGVALWKKQVEPNETWKIRAQYTITYPSDRILQRSY